MIFPAVPHFHFYLPSRNPRAETAPTAHCRLRKCGIHHHPGNVKDINQSLLIKRMNKHTWNKNLTMASHDRSISFWLATKK